MRAIVDDVISPGLTQAHEALDDEHLDYVHKVMLDPAWSGSSSSAGRTSLRAERISALHAADPLGLKA